jgi:aldehyde dehydrogenase (NAD+)
VRPTVFVDITSAMTIAREKNFGLVLSVMIYASEDKAVRIADDAPYGLGGCVFASSGERGLTAARRIRAGRVAIDAAPASPAAPMGGYKQPGNGREMDVFGLEAHLETKAIFGAAA